MQKILKLSRNVEAHYVKNPTTIETIGQNALPSGMCVEFEVTVIKDGEVKGVFHVFQNISGIWLDHSKGFEDAEIIREFKAELELNEIRE